jgi:hypothetical protein
VAIEGRQALAVSGEWLWDIEHWCRMSVKWCLIS